ncbi:cysteine desulfurase family protein [Dethiosulfovibrio peptidovorans DSM 11002]|uniref:cysteine desulfurase n=1 Tax=Dethiosulfovibrio peptidovorans DSM 11002 TaxID=469381 RepID=D2Z681_9BACT|nr:aminotransferase class V-fold PLP-dependent enzyme [Dethiosulfovibrio peptidovorans]EFC90978.1 cysteine desulfurase family protein [Dethiosulfovibrio peptidovorans DSM 11002]
MSVYVNNAATSWPKPECVPKAVFDFMTGRGANLARGAAAKRDVDTLDMVMECREALADLFCGYRDCDPRYVTFTSNVTESLNVVLKGYLRPGMTVATTSMEHNAVIRPLRALEKKGINLEIIKCDDRGRLDPRSLELLIESKTIDMVVIAHGSNLCGVIQDVKSVGKICKDKGVPFVLDTAQTAGVIHISASDLGLSALCFTGHKGLMGPQGIGGIVWEPSFAEKCSPFVEGGTGSFSDEEYQPTRMPDKFEAGTPNLPAIAGLLAAVRWIEETGIETIHSREKELGERLLKGLIHMKGIEFHGPSDMENRLPVFAVNFDCVDNGTLAGELADMGIETRPGLHCAPLAHKTLGSFPQGALRLSVGYFNTEEDVDSTLNQLSRLVDR